MIKQMYGKNLVKTQRKYQPIMFLGTELQFFGPEFFRGLFQSKVKATYISKKGNLAYTTQKNNSYAEDSKYELVGEGVWMKAEDDASYNTNKDLN